MKKTRVFNDGQEITMLGNETGEVIHTIKGKAVLIEETDSEIIPNWQGGVSFVKLYEKAAAKLGSDFPAVESQMCMRLIEYVSYEDNILRKNGKCMTIKDLAETFGYEYEPMRRLVKAMQKHGILCIAKVGNKDNPKIITKSIFANPYIFTKGNKSTKTAYELFRNSGWEKL